MVSGKPFPDRRCSTAKTRRPEAEALTSRRGAELAPTKAFGCVNPNSTKGLGARVRPTLTIPASSRDDGRELAEFLRHSDAAGGAAAPGVQQPSVMASR